MQTSTSTVLEVIRSRATHLTNSIMLIQGHSQKNIGFLWFQFTLNLVVFFNRLRHL